MTQKTLVVLVDDLDGTEATETVSFALDGTSYELDLNDKNAAALRDALSVYVGVARKTNRGNRTVLRGKGRARAHDLARVREWARVNGLDVSDRGRISASIQEAFDAAH